MPTPYARPEKPADGRQWATRSEFAAILGVAKSYITKLGHAGKLVLSPCGNFIDVDASKRLIQASHGAPGRAGAGTIAPAFADHKDKREYYQAEKERLDYEERLGQLMQTLDVKSAIANAATTLRTRLEVLPDQLAPQLAAMTDETTVRATLANEIEALLSDLSNHFGAIARQGA